MTMAWRGAFSRRCNGALCRHLGLLAVAVARILIPPRAPGSSPRQALTDEKGHSF